MPADNNARKGQLFETRLATLFLVRATQLGYPFEIMMGNAQLGGKFDDLVFRYQTSDGIWRYRYLQAKHKAKVNEKIRASQLLDELAGDFSLCKYFQSYCKMVDRGDDVQDCTIITNIDFDVEDLKKNGIVIDQLDEVDDILCFQRCKLKFNFESAKLKLSEMKILAKQLKEFAKKKKTVDLRLEVIENNHFALVKENVIDVKGKKFHRQFIDAIELTNGAKELRQYLEQIDKENWKNWSFLLSGEFGKGPERTLEETNQEKVKQFLNQLIFVVKSPNEEDFHQLLENNDIRRYYSESESGIQMTLIFEKVESWMTKNGRQPNERLTPEFGRDVLLFGVDMVSYNYFTEELVKKSVGFNEKVIQEMGEMIKKNKTESCVSRVCHPPGHLSKSFHLYKQLRNTISKALSKRLNEEKFGSYPMGNLATKTKSSCGKTESN